ncbi:MAG: hypothetical protein ABFD59_08335 [Smithella sp.]
MKCVVLALTLFFAMLCRAQAGPQYIAYEGKIGTNSATVISVAKNPIGYIDEILFQAPSRVGVTSVVTVVSAPNVGSGIPSTVLYTNATMTAADVIRPRVAQDDNTGAALTSLTVAERFLCNGDPVTLRVQQVSLVTNVTVKMWLKLDNQ